ncbi:hypothetical protein [Neobacillus cucumis]|uniref:hypothetical protein n=1 Tax=Neobacillus cucumis TaxID=1740721 RepID=UPI0028536AE7|nr:hypothetical protein [Neobacillus cucumis]MDR4949297.1 hypothetical protein [Neobacillus cucumis]
MKGKWLLIIILVVVFSGGRIALANSDHSTVSSTSNLNGQSEHNMEGMDMSGGNNTESHDMEGMDMSGGNTSESPDTKSTSSDHNTSDGHDMEGMTEGEDMEGMDMGGSGGHSHEPVKEEPANLKVLGTFGAVNLSFIVIGVWNKWFRRKDGSSGNSKRQVI